jgi:hypothetical protein
MHNEIGSKWSQISKMEPLLGRTVSQIKNRFYQNLKDKDISQIKYKMIRDDEHLLHSKKRLHFENIDSFENKENIA